MNDRNRSDITPMEKAIQRRFMDAMYRNKNVSMGEINIPKDMKNSSLLMALALPV